MGRRRRDDLWPNLADYQPLGYTEEYVGYLVTEFHADAPVIEDVLRRLTAGDRIHDHEARFRCKDRSIRRVLVTSSARFDEEGNFLHTRCFTAELSGRRPEGMVVRLEALCREVGRLSLLASRERGSSTPS